MNSDEKRSWMRIAVILMLGVIDYYTFVFYMVGSIKLISFLAIILISWAVAFIALLIEQIAQTRKEAKGYRTEMLTIHNTIVYRLGCIQDAINDHHTHKRKTR